MNYEETRVRYYQSFITNWCTRDLL